MPGKASFLDFKLLLYFLALTNATVTSNNKQDGTKLSTGPNGMGNSYRKCEDGA